ncbi:hypothetical protein Q604_UNBC02618G0001, partial [human gut metagenome]
GGEVFPPAQNLKSCGFLDLLIKPGKSSDL